MGIVFDESLYTGDERIDAQHQELISRVNRLLESCEQGTEKLTAVKTLDFLMDYTDYHFSEEEALQENAGYPHYEAHKKLHEEFRRSEHELREMLEEEEGPTDAFVAAVNKNITDWLVNHIRKCDTDVASFINGKK